MKIKVEDIRKWLRTLEENKWRKRYKVDAKRISYFTNNGVDSNLPESFSKNLQSYSIHPNNDIN